MLPWGIRQRRNDACTDQGTNGQPSDTVNGMEIPGFRGDVIAAEHADYDDARAVWNGRSTGGPD